MRSRRLLALSVAAALAFPALAPTPEEFAAFTKTDIAKWAKELKAAGIKPQ